MKELKPGGSGGESHRKKTALVLSAGGMFGAYQAGAYQVIADSAPPDIVVGVSVGALNGWTVASGCSPAELIARWLDPAAGDALTLYPSYRWIDLGRRGWFDPAPLRAQAEGLWREYEPRIPFGVVVIELPRLQTRLVTHPDVRPAHLHATCSIPLFLPPVEIDGRRYLDGGIFDKLPIWAAVEMGATRIVAIDSLPNVGKWWMHLGIELISLFKPAMRYPRDVEVILISPSEPLGDANAAVFWKRENVERWIELGMRDTARALEHAFMSR